MPSQGGFQLPVGLAAAFIRNSMACAYRLRNTFSLAGIFLLDYKSLYPQRESHSRKPSRAQSYAKHLLGYKPGGTQARDFWTPRLQHLRKKPEAPKGGNIGTNCCEERSAADPHRRYPEIAAGISGHSQPGSVGHRLRSQGWSLKEKGILELHERQISNALI